VLAELAPRGPSAKELALKLAEEALAVAHGRREDDMTLVVVRRV
jgi:serine phosphatase RsbU (regulator of sigma subunit)